MDFANWFIEILDWFPNWFIVIFISMIPIIELRGAIPVALTVLNMNWKTVLPLAIIGNLIPVPFILLYFDKIEIFLRRFKIFNRFFDWIFERTRRRAEEKIKKYGELIVILFVAIPLPFTGAWTGSLVAYLFEINFKKAFLCVTLGVIIAGVIVTLFVEFFNIVL